MTDREKLAAVRAAIAAELNAASAAQSRLLVDVSTAPSQAVVTGIAVRAADARLDAAIALWELIQEPR